MNSRINRRPITSPAETNILTFVNSHDHSTSLMVLGTVQSTVVQLLFIIQNFINNLLQLLFVNSRQRFS